MLNIVTPINHKMRQLVSLDRPRTIIATSSILALLVALAGVFLFLMPAHAAPYLAPGTDPSNFVTTWKTDNGSGANPTSITIPTLYTGYSYNVDWDNDGVFDQMGITGDVTHDFGSAGTYTIRISGSFPRIYFPPLDEDNRMKIVSIDQWGTGEWGSMEYAFNGANNLVSNAMDKPDLSNVTSLAGMFYGASIFTGDLSGWDTSNVTNMSHMFSAAQAFNSDLSAWDTSNVTDMTRMFYRAQAFNSDLSNWDTSNVTNMLEMFSFAISFNGNISNWDTGNVINMSGMFTGTNAFNSDLSAWDTSNVTNMTLMFNGALVFNSDLSNWDTSKVTTMYAMFNYAPAFNSDLSNWDTSKVTEMTGMFASASAFNQNISNWDLSSLTNMDSMFQGGGLSTATYDAMLVGWSLKQMPHNVDFRANGLEYCAATAERQTLINSFGWTFTDDSVGCKVLIDGADSKSTIEGKPVGSTAGILSAKDFTPRSVMPYAFSCAVQGVDDGFFTIGGANGDELKVNTVLHHASPADAGGDNVYDICIQMKNAGGKTIDTPLQITVTPLMSVASITPNKGNINTTLLQSTIAGGPFDSTVTVKLGTTQVNIDYVNQTNIYFIPPQSSVAGSVDVTVTKPGEAPVVIHDGFTYTAPEPKVITSVTFSEQGGNKLLTVHGTSMIDDAGEYMQALARSLVTLNGSPLKFCAFGGMTAAQMIAAYSGIYPAIGDNVTDDAPCYMLTEDGATIDMTSTQAKIRIPPTFDTTAQGTVSVNGSPVYTFNQQTTPGVDEPTAIVENKPLTGVPVIPKRPHFSGTAEPGATVTVTVHSDPISCTALADSNGNWACQLPSDLEPGQHTVNIHIVLPGGGTQDLGPYTVTVNPDGTSTPITNTTPLAPNTGFAQTVKTLTTQPQGLILLATLLAALGVGGMVARERRRS